MGTKNAALMDVQADLSLCWAHMPKGTFSDLAVHIYIAPDKAFCFQQKVLIILFLHENIPSNEALLMNTHNISFRGKIKKKFTCRLAPVCSDKIFFLIILFDNPLK